MSESVNIKAAVQFQVPEAKLQAGNLMHSKDLWKSDGSKNEFENYLKTATQVHDRSFQDRNRNIRDDQPLNQSQTLNRPERPNDESSGSERQVSQKEPEKNFSDAKMNSKDKSDNADTSNQAPDQTATDDTMSNTDGSQTNVNLTNQALAYVNPEIQPQDNIVTQLVAGDQTLVTGVTANVSDLNLVALTSPAGEQVNQESQNTEVPPAANEQLVSNIQPAVTGQETAVTQVAQTVTVPNQTLTEAGNAATDNQTKKSENNSQGQVPVIDTTVAVKENNAAPLESLNSAVLKAFQNKVAEQAAVQNVSHSKEELQQNLQNADASKTGAVSGEGKPLNIAVLQTQLAVKENPENIQGISSMQLQQHQVSSGQLQETAATGTQTVSKDHLFGQIVENAKLMLAGGQSEMEINLKPEHLGKLQLKVAVENQVVTARFVAESQQVKEIIETNLNQLRDQLRENGLHVDNLTVSVGTGTFEQNYNQTANNQGNTGFSRNSGGFAGESDESGIRTEGVSSPKSLQETMIDLIA